MGKDFRNLEVTMHNHQYQTMAKIKQVEMLREAAEQRVAQSAQADTPRPATRWLVIGLCLGALAIGLVLLHSVIWAG